MATAIQGDEQRLSDAQAELSAASDALKQAQADVAAAENTLRHDNEAITNAQEAQASVKGALIEIQPLTWCLSRWAANSWGGGVPLPG